MPHVADCGKAKLAISYVQLYSRVKNAIYPYVLGVTYYRQSMINQL